MGVPPMFKSASSRFARTAQLRLNRDSVRNSPSRMRLGGSLALPGLTVHYFVAGLSKLWADCGGSDSSDFSNPSSSIS